MGFEKKAIRHYYILEPSLYISMALPILCIGFIPQHYNSQISENVNVDLLKAHFLIQSTTKGTLIQAKSMKKRFPSDFFWGPSQTKC